MFRELATVLREIPEQWYSLVIVALGSAMVIFYLFRVILKQHDVITKMVLQGQALHELVSSVKSVALTTAATHSIVAKHLPHKIISSYQIKGGSNENI